jgi:hypothetical protein
MQSHAKWKAGSRARSDRARAAANVLWQRVHAAAAAEPERETRFVELTIRDSHRPLRVIRLQAEQSDHAWGRWAVDENGSRIGARRFGRSAISEMIARSLG